MHVRVRVRLRVPVHVRVCVCARARVCVCHSCVPLPRATRERGGGEWALLCKVGHPKSCCFIAGESAALC